MIKNLLIAILLSVSFVGVASADPNVERDARNASDNKVCNYAPFYSDKRSRFHPYFQEAVKRGLSCGTSSEHPIAKAKAKAETAKRLAGLEPTDLCNKSVNSTTGEWDVRDEWKPYTDEAKRRGLTCEDRKAEVRQQLAAAGAERDRKTKAKRQADLLALQTNPMTVALAEEVALSLPFKLSLVPQMNDLMLCVQGKFRKNDVLSAEISKRGIRCGKLLDLMQ